MLFTVDTEVSYFAATLESVSPLRQAATMRLAPHLSTTSPPIYRGEGDDEEKRAMTTEEPEKETRKRGVRGPILGRSDRRWCPPETAPTVHACLRSGRRPPALRGL